ncbi:MAG TPA: hypothetical protein VN205_04530 [Thermomonas sp.]|nr:hypothetical protein [Thermomonas sp.]
MQHRKLSIALAGIVMMAASFAANSAIVFTHIGETAPPATLGGHAMTPFATAPQAAIPDYSSIGVIPGNPFAGDLTITPNSSKFTLGASWGTDPWPGSYLGPVFFTGWAVSSRTLTLPPNTKAFYFYLQNNDQDRIADTIIVTSDSGATSGPVVVQTDYTAPDVGAHGFGFHSTNGESIVSITVQTTEPQGFGLANFGINAGPTTTCASEGYTGTKLEWCKNICERGYTGATLNMWIRRWVDRYRILPYCALAPQSQPE